MVHKISFKNYKLFQSYQELELRPVTVLIGKNSAGKSAVAKLLSLISRGLEGISDEAIQLEYEGIELGAEFRDLIYGRSPIGNLELSIHNNTEHLEVNIAAATKANSVPQIIAWKWTEGSIQKEQSQDIDFKGFRGKDRNGNSYPKSLNLNVDHLGPFRVVPQRINSPEKGKQPTKVLPNGKNAYALLYQSQLLDSNELIKSVNNWYKENFEGWGVRINRDREPYYEVELTWNNELFINIRDVGEGMGQVLPIIVRAFMPASQDTLIVIEQPELHLHPAAHGNLAQLFAERAKAGSGRYFIETHSKNLVLRFRRLVAEGTLSPEDLIIYYVDFDEESGSSSLKPIEIDALGKVSFWPEHIFSESLDEAIALRTAQIEKESNEN